MDLTGNVIEGLDNKEITLPVFLDMSKAFGTIDHEKLFTKLEDHGTRVWSGPNHVWLTESCLLSLMMWLQIILM